MMNSEPATILRNVALLLEMDDVRFKPRAYESAAKAIEALPDSIEEICRRSGVRPLLQISGIGKSIAEKVEEFINTGHIQYYEELKKKVPLDLERLSQIEGVGPKRIKNLWRRALWVRNIDEFEKAAQAHKICKVPGFRERTEKNILKSIVSSKIGRGWHVLGFVLPLIDKIENRLKSLPEVKKVAVAGSVEE